MTHDFTKEELEDLIYILDLHCSSLGEGESPVDYIDLQDKIKALIDNYCNHPNTYETQVPAQVCSACGCYKGQLL